MSTELVSIDEDTTTLIEYMGWMGAEYVDVRNQAFVVFVNRFQRDIHSKLITLCRRRGYSDVVAEELTIRTFDRFLRYGRFDPLKSTAKSYDNGVKLYLYRIAENVLNDYSSSMSDLDGYDGSEEIVFEIPLPAEGSVARLELSELKKEKERLDKLFDLLSPKHKIVYLTYKAHHREGKTLPRSLTAKLQKELCLTQSTIRVYKKEAIELIEGDSAKRKYNVGATHE